MRARGRLPGSRGGDARDSIEVEALRSDRYIDALLAAAERGAFDAPADPALDPAVRTVVRRLRRELVRVHPSFRFEERLARRLAETADRLAAAEPEAPGVDERRFGVDSAPDPAADPRVGVDAFVRRRPILVGGAMASAALSLAGAAFVVARRRGRRIPAMTRAASAAHAARRGSRRSAVVRRLGRAPRAPLA